MRPSMSPALVALALAWAGVEASSQAVTGTWFGETWHGIYPVAAMAATLVVALLAALVAACCLRGFRAALALGCAGLVLGTIAGALRTSVTTTQAATVVSSPLSAYELMVTTDPTPSTLGGWGAQADVLSVEGGRRRAGRVWVRLPASAGEVRMGSRITAVGRWSALENDDWGRSLLLRGCCASVTVTRVTSVTAQGGAVGGLRALRGAMLGRLDLADEAQALTAGVVLGQQAALSELPVYRAFSNLGLTHLVAVSGSHLAVVAGVLAFGLRAVRARPAARLAVTLCALAAYVVLSGLQPSAIRSLLMVAAALSGMVARRRSHALSALGLAALAMLLADPTMAHSLGFALSVLSVLGIACFGRLAQAWVGACLPPRTPEAVTGPLALALVAQACTLPLTLPTFGVLPVLSPLANVCMGPLMSALLLVGLVCVPLAAVVPPGLAGLALAPCDLLGSACCALADVLARVPYAAVPAAVPGPLCAIALVAVALAAYALWPQPRAGVAWALAGATCGAVALTLLAWRLLGPARVVVLDVGQGDAILVQQGAHALLVDTGPGDAVVEALGRMHVIHLDAVLLTHTDADHAAGLEELQGLVRVEQVVVARGVTDLMAREKPELLAAARDLTGEDPVEVGEGDSLAVGGFALSVLAPSGIVTEAGNASSIVMAARYLGADGSAGEGPGLDVLLTGDAESDQVEPLLRQGALGEVDVLKVGHHGSAVSTTPLMLEALRPALAVASAGEGNRYGHPTETCQEVLAQAGVPLACTIWCGDVDMRPSEGGVAVRTGRGWP